MEKKIKEAIMERAVDVFDALTLKMLGHLLDDVVGNEMMPLHCKQCRNRWQCETIRPEAVASNGRCRSFVRKVDHGSDKVID